MQLQWEQLYLGAELDKLLIVVIVSELFELHLSHLPGFFLCEEFLMLYALLTELCYQIHKFVLHVLCALELRRVVLLLFVMPLAEQMAKQLGYLFCDKRARPGENVHEIAENKRVRAGCQLNKTCLAILHQ